ncbi:hypothetical protein AU186_07915 [Mycobacterium sp. GA-1999]|nr:hypothetical protein AU185_23295 [Mycobacterium sp. GA-0227b]KUH92549.1 hypothetical protein AU186_07915 [Mycobacterium sp. GA-1999]
MPDPPTAAPLPPLVSGGRRTAVRAALVAIAGLVSLATLAGLGVFAFGLAGSRIVTNTQVLPADMQRLSIDTGDVPVAVRITTDGSADEPRVDLRMVTRADGEQPTVVTDNGSSRVTLGAAASGFPWYIGTGELTVVLPPDVARGLSVTVDRRAGSLTTDADLDELVANIDDGAVTLGGSARVIDVAVRRGDISTDTRIAVSESFRATAETGSISVEFRAAPRTTEAIAGGDVTVGLPGSEPYRVRAQSELPNGETVTVPETPDPSAPVVTAHSKSGSVKVTEIR